MKTVYDIVIVGAGVTGAFIARSASKYDLKILLIDKENDVGNVTSMANSAIVHSGYDPKPGTYKAKFNVLGNKMFPQICKELDVTFKQIGSLTIAMDEEQFATLKELQIRSNENGVETKLLNKEEVLTIEPNINKNIFGALLAPSAGIVDTFNLVAHAVENAVDNGVNLVLGEEVLSVEKNDLFVIKTNKTEYLGKTVVNASGLNAATLIKLCKEDEFEITPRKGEYYVFDHFKDGFVNHTLFPLPSAKGKGILVSPTSSGNYIAGPSSEPTSFDDFDCDSATLSMIRKNAMDMVPTLPMRQSIRVFAGLRATPSTHDFVIKEASNQEGLFIVGGIESPGLTSAPAIGEYVVNELISKRLTLIKKNNFNPNVKPYILRKKYSQDEWNEIIRKNPNFGKIICNCEEVSLGEIEDCLSRSVPPKTIKAIKKRTRAGFGKCQGGFCQPSVLMLLAKHYGIEFSDVLYDKNNSNVIKESVKGEH